MRDVVALAASMGRSLAERRMTSTWRVTRTSGAPDPETGQAASTTVYDGPGRLGSFQPYEQRAEAGGADVVTGRRILHLPVAAPSVQRDDLATCTADDDAPELVGKVYRVVGPHRQDQATAQRVAVEERL